MSDSGKPRSHTIAVNSIWMTADNVLSIAGGTLASVAVARTFGPELLGYYTFVMYLVQLTSTIGRFGLPVATRKYLAEFAQQPALAHGVLRGLFRIQFLFGILCMIGGAITVIYSIPRSSWPFALAGILSILPSMISAVVTGANLSAERFSPNVKASVVGTIVNLSGIFLTVFLGGGLWGLSSALFISRVADLAVRYFSYRSAFREVLATPPSLVPPDVRQRILKFCLHQSVLQGMTLLFWDRSEIFFLKAFSPITQLAFYSISFGIVSQTTLLYRPFAAAAGVSLMRRHISDPVGAGNMTATMMRYTVLIAFPVNLGLAAVSSPLMTFMYGSKYLEAIPILAICGIVGSARALILPAEQFLVSAERQDVLIRAMLITAAVNIPLNFLLIPKMGAIGAAISNGIALNLGMLLTWWLLLKYFPVVIPWRFLLRCLLSAVVMATVATVPSLLLPPTQGLLIAIPLGVLVFLSMLRLTRCMTDEDRQRLDSISQKLPKFARMGTHHIINFVVPQHS